ncbi:putative transcription factor bHLH041 isoform X2 [Hevea brasiliensis]|uniref:putative transcription factor bHLH041 isoform X2 n=1 Tax=Hevea brasiliensis TaxID=3981 RepID=UPI0025D89BB3|nr:putative transcription factor bHLH041 isoform X2 [Hevea brasiliensis]
MDTVFSPLISDGDRATYLRSLMQSFGCNYICLWRYFPQPNHLHFMDGYYHEEASQPGSSSGSLARRLFDEYRRKEFFVVNDRVPGVAFINNQPYRELNESELQRMASVAVQQRFYQEARIKTAVFMGCRSGEIEMGWSNGMTQINMENAMRSLFPEDIPHQQSPLRELSQAVDPNRPSSSSSSLRSLSMDSPDSSPFLFNIPTSQISEIPQETPLLQPIQSTSSAIQQVLQSLQRVQSTTSPLQLAMQSLQPVPSTTSPLQPATQSFQPIPSTTSPHQAAMQAFALTRNIQLPSRESEDAAMTRAILAVLTSPSSSTSSSITPNLPYHYRESQRTSAFKNYLTPTRLMSQSLRKQSMLKRAITYYRSLNTVRREHMLASRPTSTQLHHMISERRRREKINESFEALRKILPTEAKKDKASVLTRTREYLTSLKAQVEELSKRNQQLEAQVLQQLPAKEVAQEESETSSTERVELRLAHVSESTSEEQRIIDLQVVLRGECPIQDMVIRILEFLNQVNNVNVMSVEANTRTTESRSMNRVILRLKIEGEEWDESAFQEAVRRVVADLAQ